MNILIAPNAFKGSLSASQAALAMKRGVLRAMPDAKTDLLPVCDGGDGTLDALETALALRRVACDSVDALLRSVRARCLAGSKTAAVEMASICGLAMLAEKDLDPLRASSEGLGRVLAHVLAQRPETILVGIGGSASTDAGSGLLAALGSPFRRKDGTPVLPGGAGLSEAVSIDLGPARKRLEGVRVITLCDVVNPLAGPDGAAHVFAAQKGAAPEEIELLDALLVHAGNLLAQAGAQIDRPGAGAAGGTGAALFAAGAELKPGFAVLSEICSLEERLQKSDLVLSAEGRLDSQTMMGKAPGEILKLARKHKKRCALFGGSVSAPGPFLSIVPGPMTLEEAKGSAADLLEDAVYRWLLTCV